MIIKTDENRQNKTAHSQGQVNMSPELQVKLRNFALAINKIAKHWEFCLCCR